MIDLDTFVDAVREVLKEKGEEFTYSAPDNDNSCYYGVLDGDDQIKSSCLFGAVFIDKLKVSYSPEWEETSLSALVGDNVALPEDDFQANDFLNVFNSTQSAQDIGERYAYVSEVFERGLDDIGYTR